MFLSRISLDTEPEREDEVSDRSRGTVEVQTLVQGPVKTRDLYFNGEARLKAVW
jgi:hypothetical protein